MFGWLQDLINAISKAISEAFSGIGQEITSSIWTTMLTWFYDTIYGACADFFSMMGNMGAEIFDLKWVQATVYLFTLFGWGLFVAGIIVSVFDFAIEYQNGRGNIKNTMLNILKGFFACSLIGVIPIELYKFTISLQNTFANDISFLVAGKQALDVAGQAKFVLGSAFSPTVAGTNGLFSILVLIAFAYCVIKIFFQNIKRGGILLVQMSVGSLYMFSVPRGYTDSFVQWMKQVVALCLTAFMQTTLLYLGLLTFPTHIIQEPEIDVPSDIEPDDEDVENEESEEPKNKWELYRQAKELLDKDSENYNPQLVIKMFMDSARLGCSVAKYQLGKLFITDEHRPKDVEYALRWLEEAADDGNHYAEYLIGKLYLKCEDIEQDAEEAESYLRRASEHGNKYASYALAKAYLDGELFGKNIPEAIKHLTDSADKGFAQAEYLLGKLLYRGEIIEKDVGKALEYLERAIGKGNSYAAYLAGTILLTEDGFKDAELAKRYFEIAAEQGNSYAEYQLGKMYLFGKATEKDFEKAMEYLKFSAEHGNKYAEQLYQNAHSNRNWAAGMGAFRLFHHLARLIQNKIDDEKKGKFSLADRKLRRMINEKKEAQGLRLE